MHESTNCAASLGSDGQREARGVDEDLSLCQIRN